MPPSERVQGQNTKVKFPYDINLVDKETTDKLLQDFTGERTGFVQVGPKKYFFPYKYLHDAESIYNFPVRQDDVFIVTFPRSGTTWTQEMVWLLCNQLDFEGAARVPLLQRVPFFEYSLFVHKNIKAELLERNAGDDGKLRVVQDMDLPMWDELQKVKGRRYIKTHMPFSLLPPNLLTSGCKIIYVARNPKDVSVSFYHLNRLMLTQGYNKDWRTYWEYFSKNLQPWTPYWEHIKEGYEQRNNPNVLFMFYEEMTKNVPAVLNKLSSFLDVQLDPDQMEKLVDHLSIKNFRNNKSVNFDLLGQVGVCINGEEGFIRKGKVGNSSDFDEELSKKYEEWLEYNRKNVIDLTFPL